MVEQRGRIIVRKLMFFDETTRMSSYSHVPSSSSINSSIRLICLLFIIRDRYISRLRSTILPKIVVISYKNDEQLIGRMELCFTKMDRYIYKNEESIHNCTIFV